MSDTHIKEENSKTSNSETGINFDQVQSEFVSIAAHQLRTPLTTIRWSLQSLSDGDLGNLPPEAQRVVGESLRVTIEAVGLVNELLSITRIEEGRLPFNAKDTDILSLLKEIVGDFEAEGASRGVRIETNLPNEPISLSVDKEKIRMAVENVVDNAVAYTPRGGTVMVKAEAKDGVLSIVITDTGIGIPESQVNRLFKKFFRADNALLFRTSGTGLGLYLAKSIIDKHDGVISISSKEGSGTTVSISLPIK